jgi:hypothetical protein
MKIPWNHNENLGKQVRSTAGANKKNGMISLASHRFYPHGPISSSKGRPHTSRACNIETSITVMSKIWWKCLRLYKTSYHKHPCQTSVRSAGLHPRLPSNPEQPHPKAAGPTQSNHTTKAKAITLRQNQTLSKWSWQAEGSVIIPRAETQKNQERLGVTGSNTMW